MANREQDMLLAGKERLIPRKKRPLHYALNTLLLVILLGLFLLSFNRVMSYEAGITRTNFTIHGPLTIPVLEMRTEQKETPLVAIIVHGFAGSKDLMTGFGVEMARAGIPTYLLDLPGHGQAPANTSASNRKENEQAINEVVEYIHSHNSATKHPQFILLGHSLGSVAVGDYAKDHSNTENIISTILVSPVWPETPTSQLPKNMLLLIGQNDLASVITNSQRLYAASCDANTQQDLTHPRECGTIEQNTGRRAVILAGANHLTILNDSSAFQETLNWLHRVTPLTIKTGGVNAAMRNWWFLLGVVSIVLAMFPLCALFVDIFTIQAAARAFRGLEVFFFFVCLLVAIAAAVALQYFWQPFSILHIVLADYVGGYFFITALVLALLILLVRRFVPIPPVRPLITQIVLGILLAVFLYFTLGQLISFAWENLAFTLSRFWRFLLLFVLIFPLFLLDEGICRSYQTRGLLRGIAASFLFKVLILGGLLIAVIVTPGLDFLGFMLPVLALLLLVLAGLCTQLSVSGRAAIAGSLFSALVLAWCLSTVFPIS